LLTPYKETEEHGCNFTELPPDLMEGKPEYEVARIIDARKKEKAEKLEYLLCWKGYSPAHDSWEPAGNVKAPELIKEFYQRTPNAIEGGRIKAKRKRQIQTITTPTTSSSMSNALQLALQYPNSEEDYLELLNSSFNALAVCERGEWLFLEASLATDTSAEPTQISTFTIQEDHPLASPRALPKPLVPSKDSIFSPRPDTASPTLAYPGSPGVSGSRHEIPARSHVARDPHTLRPESPHNPWQVFGWAQPSAGDGAHQLQRIHTTDGDDLHSPLVASSSHRGLSTGDPGISPLRITGKCKRKGKKSFYCGRCNRNGVDHKYDDCPTWRECLYC
jgi:Chromo (CHRromatin Organisation MOdifier) domain